MIRYRQADYEQHVARLVETDRVEELVSSPHRALLARYAAWAIEQLGRDEGTFLDFGCRLGELSDVFEGAAFTYTGVDINPVAVERARVMGRNVTSEEPAATFDLVFCRQALQYAENVPALLRRLCLHVAPGGLLCLVQSVPYAIDGEHHFNSIDSIDDVLAAIPLPIEHAAPVTAISPSEVVFLARRPR